MSFFVLYSHPLAAQFCFLQLRSTKVLVMAAAAELHLVSTAVIFLMILKWDF